MAPSATPDSFAEKDTFLPTYTFAGASTPTGSQASPTVTVVRADCFLPLESTTSTVSV